MFNFVQVKGLLCWKWRNSRNYLICHKTIDPLKLTSEQANKRTSERATSERAVRII